MSIKQKLTVAGLPAAAALLALSMGGPAWAQGVSDPPTDTTMQGQGTGTTTPGTTDTDTTRSTTGMRDDNVDMDPGAGEDIGQEDRFSRGLPATATPLWLLAMANGLGIAGVAAGLRIVRSARRR